MGVRHTETSLVVWSALPENDTPPAQISAEPATRLFDAGQFYDAGDQGCASGPLNDISAIMRTMSSGQQVEIYATDPTVPIDLAAWCRMTGHQLVEQRGNHFLIQHQ